MEDSPLFGVQGGVRISLAFFVVLAACAQGVDVAPVDDDDGSGGDFPTTTTTSGPAGGGNSVANGPAGVGGAGATGPVGAGGASGGMGGSGGDPADCGNGVVETGEECDDGNMVDTDACVSGCMDAECGDGHIQSGVEQCDDGNTTSGDGCSATCTGEGTYGPNHTFESMTSSFYITQFGCSNSGGDPAGDAAYFCQHFYGAGCTAEPGWTEVSSSTNPMMHSGTNCYNPDPNGVSVTGTSCVGGPCKIGNYSGPLGGLTNIVCSCP
jgi:cysteine-rich repeat protein